jgi:protein-S-isoprenylcysteine O-methyltransferase Ste14
MTDSRSRPKLPDLGPRGEGWVVAQLVMLGLIIILGLLDLRNALPKSAADWLVTAVGAAEMAIAASWVLRAFRDLGHNLTALPRPLEDGMLVRGGIYAAVRHPIYAGLIVGAVGWATVTRSLPALAASVLLAVLLDLKSRREEGWLSEKFPEYAAYRGHTKRFLRGIY